MGGEIVGVGVVVFECRVGHPLDALDIEGEDWGLKRFLAEGRLFEERSIEGVDFFFGFGVFAGCEFGDGQFDFAGAVGDVGRFTFEERDTFFDLLIAEHELAEHEEPDTEVDEDIATSFAEEEDHSGEEGETDEETLGELPDDA